MNARIRPIAAAVLLLAPPLLAQSTDVAQPPAATATGISTMKAVRATGLIHIDGVLDEADWSRAPVAADFMESYPNSKERPHDGTEVRVLYDNNALYVGIRMFDSQPKLIAAQLARRDAVGIYSDWVHLMVGTYFDHRTAYRFSVNPLGVKKDVLEFNDNNEDVNWDAVWDVATRVDSLGWVAEYRIPFSQLRFSSSEPAGGRVWDIQIMRDIARRNERDSWAPWTQQSPGFVSTFGQLTGISGIPSPQRLELLPYVSAGLTRAPGDKANPFFRTNDTKLSGGADVKYGLPSGLTLTATVNPDFGQVEVDPAVVNLTAFETFFPEKRPFFLEGSDIFAFGNVTRNNDYNGQYYFYSRRIGRAPQGSAYGPNTAYVDAPQQSTILGAAKVTGKTAGWTIGLLDALTSQEDAKVVSTSGIRGTRPVEPRTNYLVGRVRRDFRAGNTVVGAMVSSVDRALGDSSLAANLRGRATVGGIDFEHAWARRSWVVSGLVSASQVTGSTSAIAATQRSSARYYQQPDATYLKFDSTLTSLSGHMSEFALAKRGTWYASVALKDVSPGFEVNDIGFQSRVDYRSASTGFGYQTSEADRIFRSKYLGAGTTSAWTYDGTSIFQSPYLSGGGTFSNLWGFSIFASDNPTFYDNRLTRGGPLTRVPRTWAVNLSVNSDTRRLVTVSPAVSITSDASGGNDRSTSVSLDMRPTSFIHLNFAPNWDVQHSTGQYVSGIRDTLAAATFGRRYVFANLSQTTLAMDTRLDWTFTSELTLQLYAQPFVSTGKYSSFKQLRAPRTYSFDVYGQDMGTVTRDASGYTIDPDGSGPAPSFGIGDPNFNIRSLHGDAVLRWEYRPGSTFYFVWQQQRDGYEPVGDFSLRRDAGAIFRAQPTNVFLVKFAYWMGL
ncbi:MAG TPA: DUF5916 domain-containing protein [Gemmatimonadaceae bacterium]|jgi:hypothetical protein